jgi:hypothetical protein
MTDIPDFQVAAIFIGSAIIWFCGFSHGKWYGIQKAEKHQQESRRMQQALKEERNKRR